MSKTALVYVIRLIDCLVSHIDSLLEIICLLLLVTLIYKFNCNISKSNVQKLETRVKPWAARHEKLNIVSE